MLVSLLNAVYVAYVDSYETFVFTHGEYGELWGWLLYRVFSALVLMGLAALLVFLTFY